METTRPIVHRNPHIVPPGIQNGDRPLLEGTGVGPVTYPFYGYVPPPATPKVPALPILHRVDLNAGITQLVIPASFYPDTTARTITFVGGQPQGSFADITAALQAPRIRLVRNGNRWTAVFYSRPTAGNIEQVVGTTRTNIVIPAP